MRLCCSQAGWSGHLTIPPGGISQSSARRSRGRPRATRSLTLKRAAVAIALTGSRGRRGHDVSADPPRREPAFARRPMGAAGRALRPWRDAGAGRAARASRRARRRTRRGRRARPARRLSDAIRLSRSRLSWSGSSTSADLVAQPGGGRLGASRRARRYRAERRLQLHHDSRKHAARDPLPPCRPAYPRADGGADLSIRAKCWRDATPAWPNWNSRCLRGNRSYASSRCEMHAVTT